MSLSKQCGIYKFENPAKIENKLEENVKKVYAMIFNEYCPSEMQNRIKEHPEHDSMNNDPLKLMDKISKSMNEPIQATYPYMSLTESFVIRMKNRQQEKEGLVDYTERLTQ